jgi:hypothetical protein
MACKAAKYDDDQKLTFLATRCFGEASEFIRVFTDNTHHRYRSELFEDVLELFDQRYTGTDVAQTNNMKIDNLFLINSGSPPRIYFPAMRNMRPTFSEQKGRRTIPPGKDRTCFKPLGPKKPLERCRTPMYLGPNPYSFGKGSTRPGTQTLSLTPQIQKMCEAPPLVIVNRKETFWPEETLQDHPQFPCCFAVLISRIRPTSFPLSILSWRRCRSPCR